MSPEERNDESLEALLVYIHRARGFDFTGYKRASLTRRIRVRMAVVSVETFEDYVDYLEVHAEEFTALFNTVLINVTSFFRDPESWDHLRDEIIPKILATKDGSEPIRIWSCGCASGEEAYALAILWAEALGEDEFRSRVKIFATDVDQEALETARHGRYLEGRLEPVDRALRERYFDLVKAHYVFRKDLRRFLIFGRHDLTRDAPISRIDLLVCRNTLMYFNSETQERILSRLHFGLRADAFLFLGRAEMLLTHAGLFTAHSLGHRVFTKRSGDLPHRLRATPGAGAAEAERLGSHARALTLALDRTSGALLVVDADGGLATANREARRVFGLDRADVGRPIKDLEVSYRPLELRSLLEEAETTNRPVRREALLHERAGEDPAYLDVVIDPLRGPDGRPLGAVIVFEDVTVAQRLRADLQRSHEELETAYEELQSTNEELETTNEELQSTNEELETTNEELQSTNEELETMNEELQSTNEELQTINDELRARSDELHLMNTFMESILSSVRVALVVVEKDLTVRSWNDRAEDLWGLRQGEVCGRRLQDLDIGLPVANLREPIARFLEGDRAVDTVEVEATIRTGRRIRCRVTSTMRLGPDSEHLGAVLLMEELD